MPEQIPESKLEELATESRSKRLEVLTGFEAFPYQQELLDLEGGVIQAAVKPGRQVGKTVTGGGIAFDEAIKGSDVMILAPFEDTGQEMMEAFRNHASKAVERLSSSDLPFGVETKNKTEWTFSHGGRVRMRTVGTDGTQIRGKNPNVVLVDEAAYIKDSIYEEVIEPFFSTHEKYQFYLFSTPAGKSGYFYDKVVNDGSWYSPHWPSEISPLISEDFLADKREQLDSTTFAQEYLGEFVDEGDTLFTHTQISELTADTELTGKVWLGVDIARGGKDRTVYTAIDESGNVSVLDSEETSTMDGVLGRIKDLHTTYGFEAAIVEENSMGGGVVDFGIDVDIIKPFQSSTKTKHQLYKQLQRDIESESLTLPNHRKLLDEMSSLEYEFTQHGYMKVSHPEGGHDDFADSLAFANWGRTGGNGGNVVRRKARVNMHKGTQ